VQSESEISADNSLLLLLGDQQEVGEDVQVELFSVRYRRRPKQLRVTRLNMSQRSVLDDVAIASHQRHCLCRKHQHNVHVNIQAKS